ncbi:ecdysteroid 22-kinase family protein [Nocardioides sp. Kera G14]|uniref:ecdysteroid 22-kinase family protein n=1 Tax=Nocardioides sp. Kera G14 TaxID=2884264 RepID=UPI001D0F81DA|nr:ecdysteroid 22-kinase family protein [Nocardioides sp. Kera G14]UDY24997.1 ecdysteroid 22-kinase family protein [Nocardioides sp. Kera G14]
MEQVPVWIDDLTAPWLTGVLGAPVASFVAEPIGTGQIGAVYRLKLEGSAELPAQMVAKLPTLDEASRAMLAGPYAAEVRFYRELVDTVAVRTPRCYHAALGEGGAFVLLLEDLSSAEPGDQLAGCSVDRARAAVVNLAGLHGPRWCDRALLEVEGLALFGPDDATMMGEFYPPTHELFLAGIGDLLSPDDHAVLDRIPSVLADWTLARGDRFSLVHGDYRVDNLLFDLDTPESVAIDWQTLSLGHPARDLAYFLSSSLSVDDRRAHERELVGAWHEALTDWVSDYPLERAWDDYVYGALQGAIIAQFAFAYSTRTDRGDQVMARIISGSCAAVRDLGTLERPF